MIDLGIINLGFLEIMAIGAVIYIISKRGVKVLLFDLESVVQGKNIVVSLAVALLIVSAVMGILNGDYIAIFWEAFALFALGNGIQFVKDSLPETARVSDNKEVKKVTRSSQ